MIPNIQWGQTNEVVIFKILVKNVSNLSLNFNNNKIVFVGYSNEKKYNINVNLYKDIDLDMKNHSYKIYETHIECKLKKKDCKNWHWFVKDQSFYKNHIKTDWNLLNKLICLQDESNNLLSDNSDSSILDVLQNNSELNKLKNSNINQLDLDSTSESESNGLASGESTTDESSDNNELIS
jgi:hypothetical protein